VAIAIERSLSSFICGAGPNTNGLVGGSDVPIVFLPLVDLVPTVLDDLNKIIGQ